MSTDSVVPAAPRVYVIHDNPKWITPLLEELAYRGLPYTEWLLSDPDTLPAFDFGTAPPHGVFFNRVSASAFTRGTPHAMEQAATIVRWLESHERPVVNGSKALALELSKSVCDTALTAHGVPAPRSVAVFGRSSRAVDAALASFPSDASLVVKPNRGGSGTGVRIMDDAAAVRAYFASEDFEPAVDGVTIIQQYLPSDEEALYRLEFVGAKLVYGVRVDTSSAVAGAALNNCPADSCNASEPSDAGASPEAAPEPEFYTFDQIGGAAIGGIGAGIGLGVGAGASIGAAPSIGAAVEPACPLKRAVSKFVVQPHFSDAIVPVLESFLAAHEVDVGGVEIVRGADGVSRVIDVNSVNSNYNVRSEGIALVGRDHGAGRVSGWESVGALIATKFAAAYPSAVGGVANTAEVGLDDATGAGASSDSSVVSDDDTDDATSRSSDDGQTLMDQVTTQAAQALAVTA